MTSERRFFCLLTFAVTLCLLPPQGAQAEYFLYAVSDGCVADMIEPGDTIDVVLWLETDNEDESNSIIIQVAFSSPGWMYNALTWHGVYAGSIYDDSTPSVLPVELTTDVLQGPGHPDGVVDIELSNVAIDPFCVDADNGGAGPCDCPDGTCIGGQCIGGPFAGLNCSQNCPADATCRNRFTDGPLATLSITVPPDFDETDLVIIQPVVDTIADGFNEILASAPVELDIYLDCVAVGDIDCDGAVTLTDFQQWPGCVTGAGGDASPECNPFDFDGDGDVDALDWGAFQSGFTRLCGF